MRINLVLLESKLESKFRKQQREVEIAEVTTYEKREYKIFVDQIK